MSTTIDQKVVEMRFDNQQFEQETAKTMGTLDKLKEKLNLNGATKGFEEVDNAARKIDMSGLSNAVETVRVKFSALEVMGVTALTNITNSAVNAGKKLVKSLTVDQVTAGWSKYEEKTGSVQTIMNATGKSIDEVNGYLEKLMWFSDETSYSFTSMTAALGQLTSSGAKIDNIIPMITGIANATAYAGKGAQEFQRSIYNITQSYGAGYLQAMDWKSLENAGTASIALKEELIKAAEAQGTLKKGAVTTATFTSSLKDKWATTAVMEEAFGKFSELSEEAYKLVDAGKFDTASEAIEHLAGKYSDLSVKAFKSAQEAKSFTEAIDATKDAVSSGWLNTFEIIFGNYEEGKTLWTELTNRLWDTFASGAEARNEMLESWKELGGRDDLIESLWNAWDGVASAIKPIKKAFRDIFPATTAKQIKSITGALKDFTSKLKLSKEQSKDLRAIFKGVFSILDMVRKAVVAVSKVIANLLGSDGTKGFINSLLHMGAAVGNFFTSLNNGFETSSFVSTFKTITDRVSNFSKSVSNGVKALSSAMSKAGAFISKWALKIWDVLKKVFSWASENITFGDIFKGIIGGGVIATASKVIGLINTIKEKIEGLFDKGKETKEGLKDKISSFFGSLQDTLKTFGENIKVRSILLIAVAIGILTLSLSKLASMKTKDIAKGVGAIGVMLKELTSSFKSLTKTLNSFGGKGIVKAALAMILMAEAIKILSKSIVTLGSMDLWSLAKGLAGVGAGLGELVAAVKLVGETKMNLKTAASMIAMAYAIKIMSEPIATLSALSLEQIAKGLAAVGGGLGELVAAVKILGKSKVSLKTAAAMLVMAYTCKMLAESLEKFAELNWSEIGRGLSSMGGALVELGGVLTLMSKIAGNGTIASSISIFIVVKSLQDLYTALSSFGTMSWSEIGRGLVAMGGALAEVGVVAGALGKIAGFSGIIGGAAIWVTVQSLQDLYTAMSSFGSMSWSEIGRGLVAMGGALLEVAGISGALGYLAGMAGIVGGAAIWVTVQSLQDLYTAFSSFGTMSWSEIGRGLVAMGGALLEVSAISGALGYLAGVAGVIGGAAIWVTVQGLQDLAVAFKKFGLMDWDEIGRGLVAMGAAMGETAIGGVLNSLGLLGAVSIDKIAEPLGVLAESLKKYGSMNWDEIGRGLAAMGAAMGETAIGGLLNTFSGAGADAIAKIAAPLGVLADSVKRWADVDVPDDLSDNLKELGDGLFKLTLDGAGANVIAAVASPMGVLADSMKKWEDVTISDDLDDHLSALAGAIKNFTFEQLGASGLNSIIKPLADLATSLVNWKGVKIPKDLPDQLGDLAVGIEAFSFAFAAGWSMSALVDPLAKLPDSVKAWKGVKLPKTLKDDLTDLANGLNSFSGLLLSGISMNAISDPLDKMSASVKKWTDVKVPKEIEDTMNRLANAISNFSNISIPRELDSIIGPFERMATAAKAWTNVELKDGFVTDLKAIAGGITQFCSNMRITVSDTDIITAISLADVVKTWKKLKMGKEKFDYSAIENLATVISVLSIKLKDVSSLNIPEIVSFSESLGSVYSELVKIKPLDKEAVNSVIASISALNDISFDAEKFNSTKETISSSFDGVLKNVPKHVKGTKKDIVGAFNEILKAIKLQVKDSKSDINSEVITAINVITNTAINMKTKLNATGKSVGEDFGAGFIIGIRNKTALVYDAAYDIGAEAVKGLKKGQDSASPSKKAKKVGRWLTEGYAVGIKDMSKSVYKTTEDIGSNAIKSLASSAGAIYDMFESDVNSDITIRPVVDISDVKAKAADISGLLNNNYINSINTKASLATTTLKDQRSRSNDDITSAIKYLANGLQQGTVNNYTINGITYDDGSNISDAVGMLVRAARVERRV